MLSELALHPYDAAPVLGDAQGMPGLVYVRVPECDREVVSSVVRRPAVRHGLRGAWNGVDRTLADYVARPSGTPVAIAGGLTFAELQDKHSRGGLNQRPFAFTVRRCQLDPSLKPSCFQPLSTLEPERAYSAFNLKLVCLSLHPYTAVLHDPFERALGAFIHHGMHQSGWSATVDNIQDFMFGKLGQNFHQSNFMISHVASKVRGGAS